MKHKFEGEAVQKIKGYDSHYFVPNPPPGCVWVEDVTECEMYLARETDPISHAYVQWYTKDNIDDLHHEELKTFPWCVVTTDLRERTVRLSSYEELDPNKDEHTLVYDFPEKTGVLGDIAEGNLIYMYHPAQVNLTKVLRKHDPSQPWVARVPEEYTL